MSTALNILLVEDSDDIRIIAVDYLQVVGHSVHAAENAEEALAELAKGSNFDVLITDVSLPGMSGLALAEDVAPRYPRLAIVISSGYNLLTPELLKKKMGREVFLLTKPYEFDTLEQVLEQIAQAQAAS
jgi:CheY-like chemotaxis protein